MHQTIVSPEKGVLCHLSLNKQQTNKKNKIKEHKQTRIIVTPQKGVLCHLSLNKQETNKQTNRIKNRNKQTSKIIVSPQKGVVSHLSKATNKQD